MFFKYKLKNVREFVYHNKKIFKHDSDIRKRKKIFLVEFNGWSAIHIIFSYIVNFYKIKKNCKIVSYECFDLLNRLETPWYKKFFWEIGVILNIKTFRIFRSFGTDEFLKPFYSYDQAEKAKISTYNFFKKKPNLIKLENYKIKNIWIGDLIYDSYLKKFQRETVNINSSDFRNFFNDSLKLFYFWFDYFKENDVEAISGCHSVYLTGIPLRIADNKNINCFAISGFNCDLINLKGNISYKKKINGSDIQFKFYKYYLKNLSTKELKNKQKLGKKIINKIIKGKTKYLYLKNSSFSGKRFNLKKSKRNKIKVAIYVHDFTDSPHIYGNHFFTDFDKWFKFLSKAIKQTDYDWYIKEHPASSPLTKYKVNEMLKSNKNLKLIKKNFPNNKIKDLGIKFVLTVYGTVASELPIFGVNVINASKNQPHSDFNFSINPKNLVEYKKIILNLRKTNFKANKNHLYSYHYVKELFSKNHLFFKKQDKYFKYLGDKPLRFTPKVYKIWLKDFNLKKHNQIFKDLEKFIYGRKYSYLDYEKCEN